MAAAPLLGLLGRQGLEVRVFSLSFRFGSDFLHRSCSALQAETFTKPLIISKNPWHAAMLSFSLRHCTLCGHRIVAHHQRSGACQNRTKSEQKYLPRHNEKAQAAINLRAI